MRPKTKADHAPSPARKVVVYIPKGTWLPAELYLRIYSRLEERHQAWQGYRSPRYEGDLKG